MVKLLKLGFEISERTVAQTCGWASAGRAPPQTTAAAIGSAARHPRMYGKPRNIRLPRKVEALLDAKYGGFAGCESGPAGACSADDGRKKMPGPQRGPAQM